MTLCLVPSLCGRIRTLLRYRRLHRFFVGLPSGITARVTSICALNNLFNNLLTSHIIKTVRTIFICGPLCIYVCAGVVRLLCARTAVMMWLFSLRPHYSPPDVDLAYLLAPFSYVILILFTHVTSHVPVVTYRTRYI